MSRTPLNTMVSGLVSNTTFSTWPNLLSTTLQDVWFKFGWLDSWTMQRHSLHPQAAEPKKRNPRGLPGVVRGLRDVLSREDPNRKGRPGSHGRNLRATNHGERAASL